MAAGIRIRPQSSRLREFGDMRNRMVIVRDVSRPLGVHTNVCHFCGVAHECKTYHLQLDGECTVIVSTTVWTNMQKLFDHGGFEQANVVAAPPDQPLSLEPLIRPLEFAPAEG